MNKRAAKTVEKEEVSEAIFCVMWRATDLTAKNRYCLYSTS